MKAEEETVFLRFLTAGEMKIKSHFGQCPVLTWPWFEPGPTPCVLAGGKNHIILGLMSYVKTGFSLPEIFGWTAAAFAAPPGGNEEKKPTDVTVLL